jgi:hypothetical protein
VRLATSIGSGLVGVCYVLDEPSIGLHPRDNQRLIDALRDLQQQGNTVLVVEHDEAMMRQADQLIDIGPAPAPRRTDRRPRDAREVCRNPDIAHRPLLSGRGADPVPADAPRIDQVAVDDDRRRHDQQPARTSTCVSAGRASSA